MARTTKDKLALFHDMVATVKKAGGVDAIEKIHASGRLTARERLDILFDKNTFEELDCFVAHRCTNFGMDRLNLPGDAVITGYGKISGRIVFAFAQDFSVMGGTLGEMHANKIVKCIDKAISVGCPVVGLNDSGGARIQEGIEGLVGYGRIFYRNIQASGVVPQIAAIMGPSAGGAVYSPALMDFVYMVRKDYAQMFITGPQVLKAITGEEVNPIELGGAAAHSEKSGNAHFVASDDVECLNQIKTLIGYLPSNFKELPPVSPCSDAIDRRDEGLNAIVPDSNSKPYDMKKVIRLVVDNGEFYESQKYFARNIITCFARMNGSTVGIIANQPTCLAGCLDINASDKAARFIRFCDCFNIPLLTFVDVPGYLPGIQQEYGGIIRHGAKMLYVYPEATVPKITIVIRKAYGGAYIGMCSGEGGPDIVLAWPTAEVAVMGSAGAANIIFRKDNDDVKQKKIEEYIDNFSTPYQGARRGMIDHVIEPRDTRPMIIHSLEMLKGKYERPSVRKHGNIPL